jgi:hypothetical protein
MPAGGTDQLAGIVVSRDRREPDRIGLVLRLAPGVVS